MWMGYAVLEPGGKTGVQHHGESETAIHVVRGVTRWWVGDRLDDVREARAGDFVFIPPGIVHGEQNASDSEPVEMVVARSTQEASVVPVHGHPHAPDHAHRLSAYGLRRHDQRMTATRPGIGTGRGRA